MTDELKQTVRIIRRAKVETDDRGRTVWTGPVEEIELELVSTAQLKRILISGDAAQKEQIRETAAGKDGILARDPERDRFEIIDDEDLKAALASTSQDTSTVKPADVQSASLSGRVDAGDTELSLVSTQALRRMLDPGGDDNDDAGEELPRDTGFDPYNSG